VFRTVEQSLLGGEREPRRLGRYVVLRRIGAGGMGVVYSAYDEQLERKVAIKVLRGEDATEHDTRRIHKEALALARVAHPNVVAVHEVGEDDGRTFIVMEFVNGHTLSRWLSGESRTAEEIVDVMLDAARGLMALHSEELVHRDVKPENIMVGDDGRVRLMDLGLAHHGDVPPTPLSELEPGIPASKLADRLTQTGALLGTPAYMAPEQLLNAPVDHRADQFSFCVTLFEALGGGRPFPGDSLPELAAQLVLEARPKPPVGAPAHVRRVLSRGLSRDPADRFPTMDALIEALAQPPRRRLFLTAVLPVGLVAAVVVAAVFAETDDACDRAAERWHGVWDTDTAATMAAAFAATDTPNAEATWSLAKTELDAWVDDWVSRSEQVCHAGQTAGNREDLRLQERCLHERSVEVEAVLGVLAEPDRRLVLRTPRILGALRTPQECDDLAALRAPAALPADANDRKRVTALGDALARARVLEYVGDTEAGLASVDEIVEEARPLGYAPLLAGALQLKFQLTIHSDPEAAFESGHEAYFEAIAGSDDALAVKIATAMAARERATQGPALRERVMWLDLVDASLRRLGGTSHARGHWHTARGLLALDTGEYLAAIEHLEQAIALFESYKSETARALAAPLNTLGEAQAALDHDVEARAAFERALSIQQLHSGADHPDTALVLFNVSTMRSRAGDYEGARQGYEGAIATWIRFYGAQHPYIAMATLNLGSNALDRGDPREAQRLLNEAIAVLATKPSMAINHGRAQGHLGDALVALGELDAAEAAYRTAVEVRAAAEGEEHPGVVEARVMLAGFLVDHRGGQGARALLTQARVVGLQAYGPDHAMVVEIDKRLAQLPEPAANEAG